MGAEASEIAAPPVSRRPAVRDPAKSTKLKIALLLFVLVWLYARVDLSSLGARAGAAGVGSFSQQRTFFASPAAGIESINIRSGPGIEYQVLASVTRDVPMRGIARRSAANGSYWIELANGGGFVKESLLTPAGTVRP